MTLTDAWKELGVDPGADAETVRRAYLRLIKTRKPESDPAGFQRAREAYEIARASGDLESIAAGSARRHHAPVFFEGAPAAAATETAGSSDSRQAPAAAPTAAPPGGGDRPQADIIFDGFSSAWNSVPRFGRSTAAPGDRARGGRGPARRSARALAAGDHAVPPRPRHGARRRAARRVARGLAGVPRGVAGPAARAGDTGGDRRRLLAERSGDAARGGGRRRRLGPRARRRPGRRAVPDRDGRAAGCARRSRARSSDPAPARRHPRAARRGCRGCRRGSAGGAARLPAGERPRAGAGARSAGRDLDADRGDRRPAAGLSADRCERRSRSRRGPAI